MYITKSLFNTWEEYVHAKYKDRIIDECKNFIFLDDCTMKYDYDRFDSYIDAMIDAIENGEDIDKVVSLVFHEKIDQPIVKKKLLKLINK